MVVIREHYNTRERIQSRMSDKMLNDVDGNSMPNVTYGFIGLGNMGSGMAKNLRAKMPKKALLIVCELDEKRRKDFLSSVEGLIEVADTPREVAERSVSLKYAERPLDKPP
jgi:hypothetical protein